MKFNKFTELFLKDHFRQTWIAYIFLTISILSICYMSKFINLTGSQRILEGVSLSYIAAYMFYFFINLYPEYTKQKQGIITIKNELINIVVDISIILGIVKSFSKDNYTNINLPNSIVYLKEQNSDEKNFFNPREELNSYIFSLHKELNNIKMKYCVLPIDLIIILNEIEKLDIGQKLKSLYDCLDKGYEANIHGFPDCFIKIEELFNKFEQYDVNPRNVKIYRLMTEQEINKYKEEIANIKSQVNYISHNGRIYKGSTRIQ